MREVIVVMAALLPCAAQPLPVGSAGLISGTVAGADGTAIVGAYVTLHLSSLPNVAQRQRFQTQWGLYSGAGGSFRFEGLRDGKYRLCVQAPTTTWLNPCEWGFTIPSASLGGANRSANLGIVLKKGVAVPVRIDDPGRVLLQNEGIRPGAHLLVGIRTPALTFRPATVASSDAGGRTYRVVIPFDAAQNLILSSSVFVLADERGAPFATRGIAIPILVGSGQLAPVVNLSVTGVR